MGRNARQMRSEATSLHTNATRSHLLLPTYIPGNLPGTLIKAPDWCVRPSGWGKATCKSPPHSPASVPGLSSLPPSRRCCFKQPFPQVPPADKPQVVYFPVRAEPQSIPTRPTCKRPNTCTPAPQHPAIPPCLLHRDCRSWQSQVSHEGIILGWDGDKVDPWMA